MDEKNKILNLVKNEKIVSDKLYVLLVLNLCGGVLHYEVIEKIIYFWEESSEIKISNELEVLLTVVIMIIFSKRLILQDI